MKKYTLVLISLLLAVSVNAQTRWGVKGGGNFSNFTTKYDGIKRDDSKVKLGFHVGGMMEYSFSPIFAIQPELLLVNTGGKYEQDDNTKSALTVYELQIPVNLKYQSGTDKVKMFITAGPYFGFGLSAKMNGHNLYKSGALMKRFDMGVGVGIGIEVQKMIFSLGYQYGIANLSNTDKEKSKLQAFSLSAGYFF